MISGGEDASLETGAITVGKQWYRVIRLETNNQMTPEHQQPIRKGLYRLQPLMGINMAESYEYRSNRQNFKC